jgi:hypothetical protein
MVGANEGPVAHCPRVAQAPRATHRHFWIIIGMEASEQSPQLQSFSDLGPAWPPSSKVAVTKNRSLTGAAQTKRPVWPPGSWNSQTTIKSGTLRISEAGHLGPSDPHL